MNAAITAESTRIGLHYYPDDLHYREQDLERWLPEFSSLEVGWLTLRSCLSRAIPERFISGLREAGIQPVIHIPESPIRPLGEEARYLFRSYARWGVSYVSVFSPPNQQDSWRPGQWSKVSPVEQFLDVFLPVAQMQLDEGLIPVFPALYPGGDYWDLAFLDAAVASMLRRGALALLDQMVFAIDAWAYNRPWDWGRGGAVRWPEARPYLTPPGSQDRLGFFGFEWVQEVLQRHLGGPQSLLMIRGGATLGNHLDPQFPSAESARHMEIDLEIARQVRKGTLPPWLHNVTFWLLAADENSPFASQAWFRNDGTELPVVEGLRHLNDLAEASAHGAQAKRFDHYFLLPAEADALQSGTWQQLQDFLMTFRPTCGYSLEEAMQAERVTLLQEYSSSKLVERLQTAGCMVEPFRPAGLERSAA